MLQSGVLLVANSGSPYNVAQVPAGGGTATNFATVTGSSSTNWPSGFALSTDGRVFFTLRPYAQVHYIYFSNAGGSSTQFTWSGAQGTDYIDMVFDSNNNFYLVNSASYSSIIKVSLCGAYPFGVVLARQVNSPIGIIINAVGDLLVPSWTTGSLYTFPGATPGGIPCTYLTTPSAALCSSATGSSVPHGITCPLTCLNNTIHLGTTGVCVQGVLYYGESCGVVPYEGSSLGGINIYSFAQGPDYSLYVPMHGLGTVIQLNSTGGMVNSTFVPSLSGPVGRWRTHRGKGGRGARRREWRSSTARRLHTHRSPSAPIPVSLLSLYYSLFSPSQVLRMV